MGQDRAKDEVNEGGRAGDAGEDRAIDRPRGFSARQVNALRRSLNGQFIRTRRIEGRELSYIEGWHAIAEANRIFGFDGWDRETVESKCLLAREARGSLHAVYVAKVRITVRAKAETIVREGYGTGEALGGGTVGEAHERALKMAETDATKRALATFGKPFGLGLYLSTRKVAEPRRGGYDPNAATPMPDHARRRTLQRLGPDGRYHVPPRPRIPIDPEVPQHPLWADPTSEETVDQSVPLKAPGPKVVLEAAGRRLETAAAEPAIEGAGHPHRPMAVEPTPAPPVATEAPALQPSAAVEPSTPELGRLLIERTTRRREPAHLKFVAAQPCLICGRTPSDAHHLRFAQPRALGRKVSDEFTVPLCRVHHRQLHQSGNEVRWWEAIDRDVDPLEIAKGLWEQSRSKAASEPT